MFHVKPWTKKLPLKLILSTVITILLISTFNPVLAMAANQTPTSTTTPSEELQTSAQDLVNLLAQEQFDQAAQTFDSKMLEALPTGKLQEAWSSLIKQMGAFQNISGVQSAQEAGFDIVYVTSEFLKGPIDIKVVFSSTGQVSGLGFTPAGTGKLAIQTYESAPYVQPDSFTEQQVQIGSGDFPLPGTLTLPNGPGSFPAVVLVHGSGPNDRDESLGPNKPFRDLAEGLASQGIAVLRYDKRTKAYPQQMQELEEQITVKDEVIDDAIAAVDLLRNIPGIDPERIYVLGHSLGGMLVPRIALQTPRLAGAIVLAGSTRPLEDIIIDQVTYLAELDGTISVEEQSQIDLLKEQVAQVKNPNLSITTSPEQLLGIPAAYWLDLRSYNPSQTASKLTIPLLILQGGRDYQVTEADFAGWQKALEGKSGVLFKQYPDLNHLFMQGTGKSTPKEYETADHVAETTVNDVASFIKSGSLRIKTPFLGGIMSPQEILRLVLLILPILLIQAGISIYALVDLIRRKKTHGPRWVWAVLLVVTIFALPSGLIVAGIYLFWGRKMEDSEYGDDDSN